MDADENAEVSESWREKKVYRETLAIDSTRLQRSKQTSTVLKQVLGSKFVSMCQGTSHGLLFMTVTGFSVGYRAIPHNPRSNFERPVFSSPLPPNNKTYQLDLPFKVSQETTSCASTHGLCMERTAETVRCCCSKNSLSRRKSSVQVVAGNISVTTHNTTAGGGPARAWIKQKMAWRCMCELRRANNTRYKAQRFRKGVCLWLATIYSMYKGQTDELGEKIDLTDHNPLSTYLLILFFLQILSK
jgi:hypothetical protein